MHLYFTAASSFKLPEPDGDWFRSIPPLTNVGTTFCPGVHVLHIGGHHDGYVLIAENFSGIVNFGELLGSAARVETLQRLMHEFATMEKGTARTIELFLTGSGLSEALTAAKETVKTNGKNQFVEFRLTDLLTPNFNEDVALPAAGASDKVVGCTP